MNEDYFVFKLQNVLKDDMPQNKGTDCFYSTLILEGAVFFSLEWYSQKTEHQKAGDIETHISYPFQIWGSFPLLHSLLPWPTVGS